MNSYSKQHALYRALKASGKIIKSIFILRYFDNLKLRQMIECQRNNIEQANPFTRAVLIGNPREYVQTEKQEQEIAEGCKRLIKNYIIYWQNIYLSQKFEKKDLPETRAAILKAIAGGSVSSWQHINLLGEYDISGERLQDSFGIKLPKFMIEMGEILGGGKIQ